MKLVLVTVHLEYAEAIEALLDRHAVVDFVRHPNIEGGDRDGKHHGNRVHPGAMVAVFAQVPSDRLDALLDDLREFRDRKPTHHHLTALVLPVERRL